MVTPLASAILAVLMLTALAPAQEIPPPAAAGPDERLQGLWEKGERALNEGRLAEALQAFQTAQALDPENGRTWNYLGAAAFATGDYPQALSRFRRAAAANPRDAKIFNNLATAYDNLGQYANAIENYLAAIELDPDYPVPYRNLGSIYAYKIGDIGLAEKYWTIFLQLKPDSRDRENILGELERLKE